MKSKYEINREKQSSHIIVKLDKVMEEKGFNKNQLMTQTNLRYETIQSYYTGTVTRFDRFVLSEFCRVLNCKIEDILEYKP